MAISTIDVLSAVFDLVAVICYISIILDARKDRKNAERLMADNEVLLRRLAAYQKNFMQVQTLRVGLYATGLVVKDERGNRIAVMDPLHGEIVITGFSLDIPVSDQVIRRNSADRDEAIYYCRFIAGQKS